MPFDRPIAKTLAASFFVYLGKFEEVPGIGQQILNNFDLDLRLLLKHIKYKLPYSSKERIAVSVSEC